MHILVTLLLLVINFLVLVVLLLSILFFAQPLFNEVPFVPTKKKAVEEIIGYFKLKPGDVLYDLGCGDGRLLFEAARQYPDAHLTGYEQSPFPYILARLRLLFLSRKNIKIHYGNFFAADLSPATHIFGYLFPSVVDRLLPKLERELKSNTTFFSLEFPIKAELGKKPNKVIELVHKNKLNTSLYVYEF